MDGTSSVNDRYTETVDYKAVVVTRAKSIIIHDDKPETTKIHENAT